MTPDGMQIEMEKLVRTPSGVRLELSTSLTPEAAKRSPGELESMQQLMFHFENEKGVSGTGPIPSGIFRMTAKS
ncbi:hypothetical protein P4H39_31115 [Paenibacillus lautus]|uniref:hypothetical protein n=1 Tax=Paenibacillus lautus TaxID=1401 RepID=UPI002DBA8F2E|nr:hypothetical protein [Paenibacillus lautus]MEC0207065.1 hypothetical protein [Paenibacillus lautus]